MKSNKIGISMCYTTWKPAQRQTEQRCRFSPNISMANERNRRNLISNIARPNSDNYPVDYYNHDPSTSPPMDGGSNKKNEKRKKERKKERKRLNLALKWCAQWNVPWIKRNYHDWIISEANNSHYYSLIADIYTSTLIIAWKEELFGWFSATIGSVSMAPIPSANADVMKLSGKRVALCAYNAATVPRAVFPSVMMHFRQPSVTLSRLDPRPIIVYWHHCPCCI